MRHDPAGTTPLADIRRALADIAQRLHALTSRTAEAASTRIEVPSVAFSQPSPLTVAHLIYRQRRRRDAMFGAELFADPAWDMLLDLYIVGAERRNVGVSSACVGAYVPPTTALRWIKTLEERGHILRSADPQDGRRVFLRLSDLTQQTMTLYLTEIAARWPAQQFDGEREVIGCERAAERVQSA